MKRLLLVVVSLCASASIIGAYTKPNTYAIDADAAVLKDQYLFSPHSWAIVKAIELLRTDGYAPEADLAQRYLLPMIEGVTFNDVWGDADLAGASVLDYYVPDSPAENFGFGSALFAYKNSTSSFKTHPFYGYENAAEEAEFRYEYARRIFLGQWGSDGRDRMAGWVVDNIIGQDDPQEGKWAAGAAAIDGLDRFGSGQTPASALLDLLQNHTRAAVVFPEHAEELLSTIHIPTKEVFDQAPEWLDEHFNDADDIEAYSGYDGHGSAWYANWTLDAGGNCPDKQGVDHRKLHGGEGCAAPMVVRLPVGSKEHAFFQLGWAIHLIEDTTTPVHTINSSLTTFQVHNDVESLASDVLLDNVPPFNGIVLKDALPALSGSSFASVYSWPPPSCADKTSDPAGSFANRWYSETLLPQPHEHVAHAYARTAAEISHGFMPYIECINTEDDRNWTSMGFFTAFTLDMEVKMVAGLIRQFMDDVGAIDRTPPAITIVQPAAALYLHNTTLTLDYSATDPGSGVKSVSATLDGAPALAGHGLASGQTIDLLTELSDGEHAFTVEATDNAGNTGSRSVVFAIVVTPASLGEELDGFVSNGAVTFPNGANSLRKKLEAAAAFRAAGDCANAAAAYQAFINELMAQTGKKVTAAAASILIADAQYLMTHCP